MNSVYASLLRFQQTKTFFQYLSHLLFYFNLDDINNNGLYLRQMYSCNDYREQCLVWILTSPLRQFVTILMTYS